MQSRVTTNGLTSSLTGDRTAKAPYWLKLVKGGGEFAGYQSADGVNWSLIGTSTNPDDSFGYAGLALTSHDARSTASAFFDSVQITTDSDKNGLADAWELSYYNQIGVSPSALAPRNDGLTQSSSLPARPQPIGFL